MIYVPEKFRPKHPFRYPSDNECEFERWYYENYDFRESGREYLPIFWTAYYCRHKFGEDKAAMDKLQRFLDKLDRSIQYYTIVQYDHGIKHDLSGLDIQVFSMSGGRTDYPLPLISQEHKYEFLSPRSIAGNFVGQITHPIRTTILDGIGDNMYWHLSTVKHNVAHFCHILSKSTFTLCPRGFGPTSFRIQEALQYGSIPVYISDEFIFPHNKSFEEYGVVIEAKDAHRVHEILSAIPKEEIERRQKAIPGIYQEYYTYEGNRRIINEAVMSEINPSVPSS